MLDLLLRGALVIDGSGQEGSRADVGVADGRIVAVGEVEEPARTTKDLDGLVLCPGIIDPHVHYDAQVLWDPALAPSSLHGVTTMVGGNCGFTIAPFVPGNETYLAEMLARVEGMPLESLIAGIDWRWSSWGDYARRLDGHLGVNAAFFAGHSTIRRIVMGDAASERAATDEERRAIVALASAALDDGAIGVSTSMSESHHDGAGRPVPSRFADRAEMLALAGTLTGRSNALFELTPALRDGLDDEAVAFLAKLAATAGTVLWNALLVDSTNPGYHEHLLGLSDHARRAGGRIVALTLPDLARVRLSLLNAAFWEAVPGWADLFSLDEAARLASLRDPQRLATLRAGLAGLAEGPLRRFTDLTKLTVGETTRPENARFLGRRLGDIAAQEKRDVFDLFIEIVLSESGAVGFWAEPIGDDRATWDMRRDIWRRPDVLVGGGDAGAHLDVIDSFAYPTSLLGAVVRDRGLLGLPEAIAMLTSQPADLFGFSDRGRIRPGNRADLVAFDPTTIGAGTLELRADLPGSGRRLYSQPDGVETIWVNGTATVRNNEPTGDLPGTLIRANAV